MRRELFYPAAVAIGIVCASLGAPVAYNWSRPAAAAPSPITEPALIIVIDDQGTRTDKPDIEALAAKIPLGSWTVQAIPKAGDKVWTRTIYVTDGLLPPKPLPPPVPPVPPAPPVPPLPPPLPPVVEGKRALLIVHEASTPKLEFSQLITNLQAGEQSKYLTSKGHSVHILDADSKNADGTPSKVLEAWRPQFTGLTLPVLLIIDPVSKAIVHKESLSPTATADSVIATLKANGG